MALTQRAIKDLRALRYKKHRHLQGRYIIEGTRLVSEALKSTADVEQILVSSDYVKSDVWVEIQAGMTNRRLTASTISSTQAMQISGTQHPQGIFAVIRLPSIIDHRGSGTLEPPLLLLDNIADPGNLGTLLRTADWFAIPTVWISQQGADVFNPKVVRSGMGAHFHIPALIQCGHDEVAEHIGRAGLRLIGAVLDGQPMTQIRPRDRNWALVIGSEAYGLTPFWLDKLDDKVTIPGRGAAESLNAAVAAGIILHYLCAQ
ncbi:MAG: RNA methyltransferase [Fidelibacterota bacterium]|nr:MAG: RNA methyltransferase [Candidatus Neomarinimicrobiota bacterium]